MKSWRYLLTRLHLRRPPRFDACSLIVEQTRRLLEEYAEDCRGGWEAGFWAEHDMELPWVDAAIATMPDSAYNELYEEWLSRLAPLVPYLWD